MSHPEQTSIVSRPVPAGNGVYVIDTLYQRPGMAASHLIVEDGHAAFVDTGAAPAAPRLLAALSELGLQREQVEFLFLTHVHLDHAGGAGQLMGALPNARAVLHPRGARHLVDPAKLIEGSIAVYGEEKFSRLYGEILPIAPDRVIATTDGQRLQLGSRNFEFIDTPGHARHHHCVVDLDYCEIYSGDVFGICYHEFDSVAGPFIFPTTTPVQFEPDAMLASVDRLLSYRPKRIYQTHFGPVSEVARLAADLRELIGEFVGIAQRHATAPDRTARIAADIFACLDSKLDAHGYPGRTENRHALLDSDVGLNTAGLEVWLERI